MNQKFVYVTYIRTTPDKLWQALTQGEFTTRYWFGSRLESDWKVGSVVNVYDADGNLSHSDKVLRAEKPKFLSYSWKPLNKGLPEEPASVVSFELEPAGPTVKLTVTHTEFPENSKIFPMISNGWPKVLSGLKSLLENEKDFEDQAFHNLKCH